MILQCLNIHNLRTLTNVQLTLHPRFNLFYGDNGSGKTSLLEACYLLSHGHSFRTRETSPIIQHAASVMTVFGSTTDGQTISVQKNIEGVTRAQLNGQPCLRSSDLARFLPCHVLHHDIFNIIDAGPATRRQVLDEGLFHVKQSYLPVWREYRNALKQRNALLKQNAGTAEFDPWDQAMDHYSRIIDQDRSVYVAAWDVEFQSMLASLSNLKCTLRYEKGWDKKNTGASLVSSLKEQLAQDRIRQYTYSGPHQADLFFDIQPLGAKKHASRGQQKILLIALKLSKTQLWGGSSIHLFDDLSAELDTPHLERVLACLNQINGQIFITGLDADKLSSLISSQTSQVFHLIAGECV